MKIRNVNNQLDEFRYCTYMIGSMEHTAEGDNGELKRASLVEELIKIKIFPINPCTLEIFKVGMKTNELQSKMEEWLDKEDYAEYGKQSRFIWKGKDILSDKGELIHIPGDFDYVRMSNWITFILNEGDKPCGSFGEAFCAFDIDRPVYLITDIPIKKLPRSLLQSIFGSKGYVFTSENQYLHFIKNEYHLNI